jgi:hypothetical protein
VRHMISRYTHIVVRIVLCGDTTRSLIATWLRSSVKAIVVIAVDCDSSLFCSICAVRPCPEPR